MKQNALCVGLIGYGTIGQEVARLVTEHAAGEILLVGALVRHTTRARPSGPTIVTTRSALLAERPQVVVEVAGHEGLREHGPAILRAGIDLLLVSTGALAEPTVMNELLDAARAGGTQARVVSGAIGALDALAAASVAGKIARVIHTMRRPPQTLLASEEAAKLTAVHEVFRGNARQAVLQFPEFLNVAAAVALASNGLDQTEVLVLADPMLERSKHEIQAEGAFGKLRFEIENVPLSAVGGTGTRLVAMSIVRTLLSRRASFVIG
jgi:aspartate dehydrogenase